SRRLVRRLEFVKCQGEYPRSHLCPVDARQRMRSAPCRNQRVCQEETGSSRGHFFQAPARRAAVHEFFEVFIVLLWANIFPPARSRFSKMVNAVAPHIEGFENVAEKTWKFAD